MTVLVRLLLVVAVCVSACAHAAARLGPTVIVDVAHPAARLPGDYLGLSFEASILDSTLLDPARSNLPGLLRDLGAGHLRIGGNSLDRVAAWVPDLGGSLPSWATARVSPVDLRHLGALSAATGWRVDLGLGLAHRDPRAAAGEASAAARLIGPGLGSVEIGNEPDDYAGSPTLKPGGYPYTSYRADVDAYRTALAAAAPGVPLAGPDTDGLAWLPAYARDERRGLSFLTQHFYPLTRCAGIRPTIADLLSDATRRREVALVDAAVAVGRRAGVQVRIDETNSASCGGQDGVSNTLASALWIVDYALLAAQRGVAGIGVQGGLAVCRGYTPLCVPGATASTPNSRPGIDPVADASLGAAATGRLGAQPDFYGLLVVHQLEGGRWLNVASQSTGGLRVFAVLMPDSSIRVVVDNPSPMSTVHLTLHAAGYRGPSTVLRLTGPSLQATSGVVFGGAAVGPDGTWSPGPGEPPRAGKGGVSTVVGPASVAVVSLRRS